jgi:hypothetical protein
LPKPFDATTKYLWRAGPDDWLALASLVPDGPLKILDAELSMVSTAADCAIQVNGPEPWLVHLELQSSNSKLLIWRLLRYNVLLSERHKLPVLSVVILLRPEADRADLTGRLEHRLPSGRIIHDFRYLVVRL